ncbi:MAG: flippase-like domain-containing protein [Halobacteriaceae archaeon]
MTDGSEIEVSVVLPAYNEADTIEDTVAATLSELESFLPPGSFEVIVAEDGCEDETPAIADRLATGDDRIRHVHRDTRLGRGGALDYAFDQAHGEVLAYFDTDRATEMGHLEELIERIRSGEYDVATGSRWLPGHEADRPAKRGVPSRGFNLLVRTLLGSTLRDHQCGFKAVSREAYAALGPAIKDDHWFWDTELLVRAQRQGFRVAEFPVTWTPKGDSKVDLVRDVFGMGSQVLRTWWEFSIEPRITRRVAVGVGALLAVVALALMTVYLDPSAVLSNVAAADLGLVAAAGIVYLVSWPFRGLRYRDILAELEYDEHVGFLTGAIFISQTGNLVFPARLGDGVRAYVMKTRRGVPYPTGVASLAVERVFDLLTITALAGSVLLGLVLFDPGHLADLAGAVTGEQIAGDPERSGRYAIAVATTVGIAAIATVAAIVASARSERNRVRAAVARISDDSYADWVAGILERFVGDIQTVASDSAAFARVGATSILVWVIDVLTAVVVLLAFDISLPIETTVAVAFFAVSVGNLAKVLPLSPGGIGLYEGAFTLLVAGLTPISAAAALGVAIVDHAVKNLVTIAGGVVSMVVLNVSLTRAVDEAGEAETEGETEPRIAPD